MLLDTLDSHKGILAENYVAQQLLANGFPLHYWHSESTSEIDFLVDIDGYPIPIEVKLGEHTQSKSLRLFINKYDSSYGIRISTKNFGYNPETKIKSIPLYAVFCIKNGYSDELKGKAEELKTFLENS